MSRERIVLFLLDIDSNQVRGIENVVVRSAVSTATSSISINTVNTVGIKLSDSDGNPSNDKSFTVDGTEVGTSMQNYTTMIDGTISFAMAPTQIGTVRVVHGVIWKVVRAIFIWLNRRSQRRIYTRERFYDMLKVYPITRPKIYVNIYEI